MLHKRYFWNVILGAALLVTAACSNTDDIKVDPVRQATGLFQPVMLQPDSTVIVLQDYFLDPRKIDSITADSALKWVISADTTTLVLTPAKSPVPRLSALTFWIDGYRYSMLLERTRKIWQEIRFDPQGKTYKRVQVAGEMNNWNPSNTWLSLKDGIWSTSLLLNPGKYQYQMEVDGKRMLDPGNPEKMSNGMGGFNSVLHVGQILPPGAPWLYTDKVEKLYVRIGAKNPVTRYFVFWQNYLLEDRFLTPDSAGLRILVPGKAAQWGRSYIRVWAFNKEGASNEILIPLSCGKVILEPSGLNRTDPQAMILYFMMVDRFFDGDTANDKPVKDPAVAPRLNWEGGDLAGITQKIKEGYFTKLGVNTLWISPITQNPADAWAEYPAPHRKFTGYHGYWPVTLSTVDPHFGTNEAVQQFVDAAHEDTLNVLLDYVSNHVHKLSWVYVQHPEWATQFVLKGGRKNIRLWDEQRLTTWFDEFLPTLDLTNPEVYNMMSDSALFWIKKYKFDGFRHDATKHVPEIYWRTLTRKINEQVAFPEERPVYQIGETYGSRELISSYINPGKMNAQFDFDVYFTARNTFAYDYTSMRDLFSALQESFNYYGEHNLMGYITGNQDQTRFISLASGAIMPGEDDREAGWKRDIEVKDTMGYRKLALLVAFNMTIPGIPVIYYGDEFGMAGANDPDNRRMMKFDSLNPHELKTKALVEQLIRLRKTNLPLTLGDFRAIRITDKTAVYMRTYFGKTVYVILNKDDARRDVDFDLPDLIPPTPLTAHFGHAFQADKNHVSVTLEPYTFEILTN